MVGNRGHAVSAQSTELVRCVVCGRYWAPFGGTWSSEGECGLMICPGYTRPLNDAELAAQLLGGHEALSGLPL